MELTDILNQDLSTQKNTKNIVNKQNTALKTSRNKFYYLITRKNLFQVKEFVNFKLIAHENLRNAGK